MLRHPSGLLLLVAVGLGSPLMQTGCKPNDPESAPKADRPVEPLRIAAASDLRTVLPIVAKRFTDSTRIEVALTFGPSGQLAEQIRGGAPFDLFLAANQQFVRSLADDGLIRPESVRPYAQGTLVLAVHRESGAAVESLADLARPDVKKIALANPMIAPYGAAGKQVLERAGLWSQVESKLVPAEAVSQALHFVATGNAEAGFVGRAGASQDALRIVPIDPSLYDPIVQALGVTSASRQSESAASFAAFLTGEQGLSILRDAGFMSVSTPAAPAPLAK